MLGCAGQAACPGEAQDHRSQQGSCSQCPICQIGTGLILHEEGHMGLSYTSCSCQRQGVRLEQLC